MIATSISRSPCTKWMSASAAGLPRDITSATPASDSSAPMSCSRVGCTLKPTAPTTIAHTGELEAISVTLSGVLVRRAMYCSAL